LFDVLLLTQLRLKGIVQNEQDMFYLRSNWKYKYSTDNYYSEMSEASVYTSRIGLAAEAQPFVGKYVSNKWIRERILKMTDAEQMQMQREIQEEIADQQMQQASMFDPATGLAIDPLTGAPVNEQPQTGTNEPTSDSKTPPSTPEDD
jgi:hypothetical protein